MKNLHHKIIVLIVWLCAGALGIYLSLPHKIPELAEGDASRSMHHPLSFVSSLKPNDKTAGKKIYLAFCSNCHAQNPVIEVGAPRFGIAKDWASWRKYDKDKLFLRVANGVGAMPARGGCFECSDEQLKKAIEFVLKGNLD